MDARLWPFGLLSDEFTSAYRGIYLTEESKTVFQMWSYKCWAKRGNHSHDLRANTAQDMEHCPKVALLAHVQLLSTKFLVTSPGKLLSIHLSSSMFSPFRNSLLGGFSYPFVQSRTLSPAHPQGVRPWPPIWCRVLRFLGHILSHFQLFNLNADQYQAQYQLLWNTLWLTTIWVF